MSSSDYGYPLSDNEYRYDNSITTEYHNETYNKSVGKNGGLEFEINGADFTFKPAYYPRDVKVGKTRDLVREKGICRNEYVKDVGTKNREIHAVGYLITPDLQEFHDMCDFGQRADLIAMQWQGEVLMDDSEVKGPVGIDVHTNHYLYEYTLDFVSTGRDEMGVATTGVVSEGE